MPTDGQTHLQTDMTQLIAAFHKFAHALKTQNRVGLYTCNMSTGFNPYPANVENRVSS
jgi:hypothetical protein